MEDKKAEEMKIAEESLEEVSGGVTPLIRRQRPLPPRCPNCGSKDCRVDPVEYADDPRSASDPSN